MEHIFKPYDKLLFVGDSITDAGRREPAYGPHGWGYAYFSSHLVASVLPDYCLTFANVGISGNTVLDLIHRWRTDVLDQSPTVLSLLIGINDSWRIQHRAPGTFPLMGADDYEQNLAVLLEQAVEQCECRLVLWEPFLVTHDKHLRWYQHVQAYVEKVGRLADRFGAVLVRTQSAFNAVLAQRSPEYWAADAVHPTRHGHALMARLFCQAVGLRLDGPPGEAVG